MGDVVGRLFREFAVTLSVTILVSAAVSLTLTPMMCSKLLLRHRKSSDEGWFYRITERSLEKSIEYYGVILRWVLRHQFGTLVVTVGTLVLTLLLYIYVPKGFFPVEDTGVLLGVSEAPAQISFSAMAERQQALTKVILADPDVQNLSSFIGVDGTNMMPNSGRIQINLKPRDERVADASQIIARLESKLASVQGITLYIQAVQDLTVEDRISRTQFQYSIEDSDGNELSEWSPRLLEKMKELPELQDVASDQQDRGLQASIVIDRNTASRLNILPQAIDDVLYDAFGQRQVSTIFTQLNQYHVVLEVDPKFQQDPDTLQNIYVPSSTGSEVPLSAFAHYEPANAPLTINHQDQFPEVTISFNLAPGVSLGDAVDAIRRAENPTGLPAPKHLPRAFCGTAQGVQASRGQ